jgi:hypothetical protein
MCFRLFVYKPVGHFRTAIHKTVIPFVLNKAIYESQYIPYKILLLQHILLLKVSIIRIITRIIFIITLL